MTNANLSGVADTLFIPLAARAEISQRFPEYFFDERAVALKDLAAVREIAGKSSEYSMMASVARQRTMDDIVRAFLARRGRSSIVNLGVGLETMSSRLAAQNAHFYELDFPEVIERRRALLGEAENETLIGADMLDLSWTNRIDAVSPVMLVVSGVFQYFEPEAVLGFIGGLRQAFPDSELVFDATNSDGIKYARRYVEKTGNTAALMHFFIDDAQEFTRDAGVELLEVRGFFDEARAMLGRRVGLYTRIAMRVADGKKRTLVVRIGL